MVESATPEVLDNILVENERVRASVVGPDGLIRAEGDNERRVDVAVALVLTDRRIVFAAAETADPDDGAAGSLPYHELAAADGSADQIELSTTEAITWTVPMPETDGADAVARDLRWIGDVRRRVVAAGNDVELAAGRIHNAAEERNWEAGGDAYHDTRKTLDGVIRAVQRTTPIPEGHLAPELTNLERTLEGAYADLLVDRARSRLTLGQQLLANGDVDQAAEVLGDANTDCEAANAHAEALERGDAFRFGEQRALLNRLERLAWEMEAVTAEPLRQAHEAKLLATATTEPSETLEHWKTAFHRFGAVLALSEQLVDVKVAGDPSSVRAELGNAAGQLLSTHETLARAAWAAGVDHHESDESEAAVEHLSSAVDHLERARELAAEFEPEAASAMDDRLESLRDGLERVRQAAARSEPDQGRPPDDESTPAGREPATGDGGTITASELAELDTHHDIAFSVESGDDEAESRETGELVVDPAPDDTA